MRRALRFCLARSTTLYPRGRTHPAPATNYRWEKPARVAGDKSKGAAVARHRSSSERRAGPMQREKSGRACQESVRLTRKLQGTHKTRLHNGILIPRKRWSWIHSAPLRLRLPSSFLSLPPLSLFLSRLASYSFSFVIRKQTERRSCQVGGVGDETAVSVRPSFFRLRHSTPQESMAPSFPPLPARSVPSYTGPLSQTSHHIFRCVDGPPDSPLRLGTIMWKEQAAKGGRYNSLPNAGHHYRALFRLPFLSSVLFTMRRNTPLEIKDGERAKKKIKIGKLDTRDGD